MLCKGGVSALTYKNEVRTNYWSRKPPYPSETRLPHHARRRGRIASPQDGTVLISPVQILEGCGNV